MRGLNSVIRPILILKAHTYDDNFASFLTAEAKPCVNMWLENVWFGQVSQMAERVIGPPNGMLVSWKRRWSATTLYVRRVTRLKSRRCERAPSRALTQAGKESHCSDDGEVVLFYYSVIVIYLKSAIELLIRSDTIFKLIVTRSRV